MNSIIQSLYPRFERPIAYRLFRRKRKDETNSKEIVLLGLDKSMWKEWILSSDDVVRVYGLVSHGRRVYRTVLFTSDMTSCLCDLPPLILNQRVTTYLSHAAGDPFHSAEMTSSLVIERDDKTLIPSRLLRGTVPSTLFESHRFWFSSQDGIVGYPRQSKRKDIIHVKDNVIFKQEKETYCKLASPDFISNSIFRHLLRIENVSDILIWLDRRGERVCKVELPRLGNLRFVPAQNGMFELVDRLGWYLCDYDVNSENAKNNEERSIFRHGIVLKNECDRMMVLVPTHELHRVSDWSSFSIDLVPWRHSRSWNSTMREFEPYVMYELHTSRAFVQFETLQSKLYLAFLKFMEREYVSSCRLVESCVLDIDLTSSQIWILRLFRYGQNDAHPDAHATRLKIALCLRYNKRVLQDVVPDLSTQYEPYLEKYAHVSTRCVLNRDEEITISQMCRRVKPVIISRWAYLKGDSGFQCNIIDECGGRPYDEGLLAASDEILRRHRLCQDFRYILRDVDVLSNTRFVDILLEDSFMEDDEGGISRGLGVLFLYELVTSKLQIRVSERDCTRSGLEILSRMFHLKLTNYGVHDIFGSTFLHLIHLINSNLVSKEILPKIPVDAAKLSLGVRSVQ